MRSLVQLVLLCMSLLIAGLASAQATHVDSQGEGARAQAVTGHVVVTGIGHAKVKTALRCPPRSLLLLTGASTSADDDCLLDEDGADHAPDLIRFDEPLVTGLVPYRSPQHAIVVDDRPSPALDTLLRPPRRLG